MPVIVIFSCDILDLWLLEKCLASQNELGHTYTVEENMQNISVGLRGEI